MNLADPIKLVSQLVDLPIVDKDERSCGIVDDVELEGAVGKDMRVEGAARWTWCLSRADAQMAVLDRSEDRRRSYGRVPAGEIVEIGSVVKLKCAAEELKLHVVENRASAWIPVGARCDATG